jgi:hypothetical protein
MARPVTSSKPASVFAAAAVATTSGPSYSALWSADDLLRGPTSTMPPAGAGRPAVQHPCSIMPQDQLSQQRRAQQQLQGKLSQGYLRIEVELWRSDLLCGLLEVDPQGKVVRPSRNLLCPPSLVLGLSAKAISAQPLHQLLPSLPPGGVTTLLASAGARGGTKSKQGSVVGVPRDMTVIHAGDRCEMAMRAQAVKGAALSGSVHVLLRPVAPCAAQPGFDKWMHDGDDSGLANPAAALCTPPRRKSCRLSPR